MVTSKSPRARLLHIRDEIEGVAIIVRGLSFVQYQDSYMHRRRSYRYSFCYPSLEQPVARRAE
jgi:hypothetical protein